MPAPFPPCRICDRPVPDRRPLCQLCGNRLVTDLREIPALLADLTVTRTGQARYSPQHLGARPAERPMPVRSVAGAPNEDHPSTDDPVGAELVGDRALGRLHEAVISWALTIARQQNTTIPVGAPSLRQMAVNARTQTIGPMVVPVHVQRLHSHTVRLARRHGEAIATPATVLEQVAMWLANDPHVLRHHPNADRLYRDITRAVAGIGSVIDRPHERRYIGACDGQLPDGSACGTELRADTGETWIRCNTCGQQSRVADILSYTLTAADPMVVTLDEALRLFERIDEPLPRGTADSWVSRRQLLPRAWRTGDGRIVDTRQRRTDEPMYQLGDIRRLRRANPGKGRAS
ncbi:hypothetical protein [Nocardia transvalensis]|uniref:hypothetical protein n=1 Tax=Nocardia transvalensis TaxID=37333 RepID=UPI0002E74734|nr:hypothetical protein [Nocardia transvalensis]